MLAVADMASKDEPLLPRLDMLVGYLEEMKGCNKSSCPPSRSSGSGTITTDGGNSSFNSSPKSVEKRRRPLHAVLVETQIKGNLVDRLLQLEERVLKLGEQLEQEMEGEKKEEEERSSSSIENTKNKKKKKKVLKSLVQSCVRSKAQT